MITVTISINDRTILARSACNVGFASKPGWCRYEIDDGRMIEHDRAAGAVALAIEMLTGIKEPGLERLRDSIRAAVAAAANDGDAHG
jgi:hypothetical protein